MKPLTRRSALGLAAAAAAAPLTATLPARASQAIRLSIDQWTNVSSYRPDKSYWVVNPRDPDVEDRDARDAARTGRMYSSDPANVWRSFFRVPVAALAGRSILDAYFTILLTHSATGTPTPVHLFHVRDIDPAVPLTWGNSADSWLTQAGTASGSSYGSQPDQELQFSTDALRSVVQAAATLQSPFLSFGLRNLDENNQFHWKKYRATSAALTVFYD
ncbi:hypothetical protein ACFCV3_25755 [Kribbella sp. NPDC056345]|uniref:hypothetical protein n=1 Tax=Kribbella sp. NPDC056345 TaxID=3345789 RepID=UPI0035DF2349